MTAIAFVGLGDMGGRMAARLLASGHELTVYNRTAERARPLSRGRRRRGSLPGRRGPRG